MLCLDSALYLGLRHPSRSLEPWTQLTFGRPEALQANARSAFAAQRFAAMQGFDTGIFGTSSLHHMLDLCGVLAQWPVRFFVDRHVYPITKWSIGFARSRGVPVCEFDHLDHSSLHCMMKKHGKTDRIPVIFTDGFCPACGRFAPLNRYVAAALEFGGILVVDDTQALGIYGANPDYCSPFGNGGGGSFRYFNLTPRQSITVSSLAKAFGVPLALLSGSTDVVNLFINSSETRIHCSPPSTAAVFAAEHSMSINSLQGQYLRRKLALLIEYFQSGLRKLGILPSDCLFPVQTVGAGSGVNPIRLHHDLSSKGIRTVLTRDHANDAPLLNFIITCNTSFSDINLTMEAVAESKPRR